MSRSSLFASASAGFVTVVGFIGVLSWIFAVPQVHLNSQFGPLVPNTALGFVLAGIALCLVIKEPMTPDRKWFSRIFSGFCILLGSLTLWQHLFATDFGIDSWLSNYSFPEDQPFPYRMSLFSAIYFIVIGVALWIIDVETKKHRRPSHDLALIMSIVPIQATLGYAYGIEQIKNMDPFMTFMPLAAITAISGVSLSLGVLFSRGHHGIMRVVTSDTPAGKFMRRLSLPAIGIPILMGGFVATADKFRIEDVAFGASLLTICCLIVFIVVLWKNGVELFRVQNQRNSALVKLEEATRQAQDANRAKSAFLANMSHEIRNPVGVMMGFADLLADPNCVPQVRSYYAAVLKRNGRTLLAILNDILDLSKVEANKLKVECTTVELTPLIRDLTLYHRAEALAKGIDFKVQWREPVPRSIATDPTRLRQILDNVIGNAIKFTERGYVSLDIRSCSEEGTNALLTFDITDTGPGIPKHLIDRLFRPFEQADSSFTRKFGGTGLGLALSKRLATAISGDLILKTTAPGKGSTFSLGINVTVARLTTDKTSMTRVEREVLEKRLAGSRILVAEDSPDNRFLIEKLLKTEGASISFAENGIQAVAKACQEEFDLVLMDIQMPQMDGLEASAQLRAKGFVKPIIALTAHAMKEDKLKSLSSGLNDHVTKPLNREELIRAVQRWVFTGKESAV